MKKLIYSLFLSIFIFTLFSVVQYGLQTPTEKIEDIEAKIDAYVKPYIEAGCFSGSILIARDGKVLLNKGYGMANHELGVPNTPRTKFHIASVSKPFTAAAIMILQERDLLSVNDPLSKFIPDYPNGNKITVHHLLTHTSGIPNVNAFPDYDRQSRFPHTVEEIVEMFKDKPLEFNPGERYSYSNSNYNLLAYVIEKLSGKSYGEFLKENIFDPLDMKNTGHHGDAGAILKNRASGYVPVGIRGLENAPYLNWSIKTGNGSLYSTVEDLYKWDRALYTEKILKKSTIEKIFTDYVDGVGYAWLVGKRFNRKITAYSGRSPGYNSYIARYVDDDACIIILSNNYADIAYLMAIDLAAILFSEKYEMPIEVKAVKIDAKVLDAYIGRYEFGPDYFRLGAIAAIKKRNDQLFWGSLPFIPLSETKFFNRLFWISITFVKDDKGEVAQLIYHQYGRDYPAVKIKEEPLANNVCRLPPFPLALPFMVAIKT